MKTKVTFKLASNPQPASAPAITPLKLANIDGFICAGVNGEIAVAETRGMDVDYAAYIVRAANAFPALVKLCKKYLDSFDGCACDCDETEEYICTPCQLRAALALAGEKGEKP